MILTKLHLYVCLQEIRETKDRVRVEEHGLSSINREIRDESAKSKMYGLHLPIVLLKSMAWLLVTRFTDDPFL